MNVLDENNAETSTLTEQPTTEAPEAVAVDSTPATAAAAAPAPAPEPQAEPAQEAVATPAAHPIEAHVAPAATSVAVAAAEPVLAEAELDAAALAAQEHEEHEGEQDFAKLLENFEKQEAETSEPDDDNVIKGVVIKLSATHVFVDINAKQEGMLPLAEVLGPDGLPKFAPGDAIDVMRDRSEGEEGYIGLSYQKAQRIRVWDDIEKAYNDKTNIPAVVIDRIKGGLAVDIHGARAFLPGSQVDVRPVRNLDSMKGQTIDVRVIKLNKKRGNIVVSRKEIVEAEVSEKRAETVKTLEEGSIITGVVKNLTDYGAFVDMGGLDGLLHVTDMSWGRLTHPKDLVHVGDHIQVKILKFDPDKQRVSLGFKQLTPDPWLDATERYPIGAHVRGKVISVTDYGAFIELEQGIEGLVHVSEMTWSKRMKHPSKLVNVGDEVDCEVLQVNPTERRISLGMRQLMQNPWDALIDKFPVGASVEGRVRNLTEFGAFIEIEDGIDGLVHVSNMSWTKRIKHPSEVLKKGDKVKAIVLAIESDKRRLSLGIKQLQPDVWDSFFETHRVGDVVHGKVLRVAAFGAFVELAEGVEGLCHNSEAAGDHGQPIALESGQEHDFKIIKMSTEEKKVGLSIRAVGEEASRAEVESYKKSESHKQPVSSASSNSGGSTIGDLIKWKQASNDGN